MTVKTLIKKLEKIPSNAKVMIRGNHLEDVKNVKYLEDYVYCNTYKIVILNEN